MQKLFINNEQFAKKITLNKIQAKHYLKVLRMKINDQLIVVNNNQKYLYHITNLNPFELVFDKKINDKVANDFAINVFMAIIKPKNIELAIKKATELNATNFYLYYFSHSQNNIKIKLSRLNEIVLNAAQQANRDDLMHVEIIENDTTLQKLLHDNDINLIAHLTNDKQYISQKLNSSYQKIGIIIGPEAGFSKKDLALLNVKNSCIINLTKSILRAETALIYALSIINEIMLRGK